MRTVPFILFSLAVLLFASPTLSQALVPLKRPGQDSALAASAARAKADSLAKAKVDKALQGTRDTAVGTAGADTGSASRGEFGVPPPPGDTTGAGDPAPGDTSAAADSLRTDTVAYSAVRIRYRDDRFSLSERALLTYKGSSMVADSIVYWSHDNIVEAMGAPLIQDPTNPPILGYKMRYNIKTKVGEIYYGSSQKGNQSFNGVEVRRQKDGEVLIARGDFSTCNLHDKHYYFYSRRMIMEPKSKVLSGPIVMDIAEVPVAVLPMMVMPLGTGRRSGLLQPKIGGDQSQGFYINNLGYYWAINEYMDYTLSGDVIEGQAGTFDQTNLNSAYRYNVRYLLNGSVGGRYFISEFDPSSAGWQVNYANEWNITPDQKQRLVGSGSFVSSKDVVSNNAVTIEEKSQQTANADLGYTRQFDKLGASLGLGFSQLYNLNDGYLERVLPNVTFSAGGPLFPEPSPDYEGEFGQPAPGLALPADDPWWRKLEWNYSGRGNSFYLRSPATASTRGDTNTFVGYGDDIRLSAKFQALQYINISPTVNVAQLWSLNDKDPSNPSVVHSAWDPQNGNYGEYFARYDTRLALDTRIYGIGQADGDPWLGSIRGARHTIVPTLGFDYAPEIDSNPRFVSNPKIGGTAFQAERRAVTFSLGNEVDLKLDSDTAKAIGLAGGAGTGAAAGGAQDGAGPSAGRKGEPYKLASTNSSVNYNFANEVREWSPIGSSFTVYLTKNVPFTIATTHMLYDDFAGTEKDELTSPILTAYNFSWRKGMQVGGNLNSGVRVRDTRGVPGTKFENSPWSAEFNYSFQFNSQRRGGASNGPIADLFGAGGTYQHSRSHVAGGGLRLNPTAGWQMTYDTDYNFAAGEFSKHAFAFHRKIHCWEMDFRWNPVGIAEGWNFVIRVTDLPDLKLESSDTKSRRVR